ncbi:MAG: redoxin domain-containing protein [Woeseiaceae bacterium]|nr:redoxin domain-containing protein [Woeseiaceae bacterium]
MNTPLAPALRTSDWLNVNSPLSLKQLRGKVVMIEAFQMLCPGCVAHGLPLAQRVHDTFSRDDIVVIGLHSVFEHHAAQGTREALEAFVHEYRLTFPVALDAPSELGGQPQTMRSYRMRGTPTLILIDKRGRVHKQHFGTVSDLALGAEITSLILDDASALLPTDRAGTESEGCDFSGCYIGP